MDRRREVETLFHKKVDRQEKSRLLNEFLLDCYNEMEAQDQNMRPEVQDNVAEAYTMAKNYLRRLRQRH